MLFLTDNIPFRGFSVPPARTNAVSGSEHNIITSFLCPKIPVNRMHRESVKFSDRKRDGPILGLNGKAAEVSDSESANMNFWSGGTGSLFDLSVQPKRIARMLDNLRDDCRFGSLSSIPCVFSLTFCLLDEDESRSKTSSSSAHPTTDGIQPFPRDGPHL